MSYSEDCSTYSDESSEYSDNVSEVTYDSYCKQFSQINGENWCIVCNVKVPFSKTNYIQHVRGNRHCNAIDSIFNKHKIKECRAYHCTICNILTVKFMEHIKSSEHIKKQWQLCPNYDELKYFIYTSKDKSSNVALAYRDIFDNLIKKNNIKPMNGIYLFCSNCQVNLTPGCEIDHIKGKIHRKNTR